MHAIQHPHIIRLYGASLSPPHMCLVLELADHGSLFSMLRQEGEPHAAATADKTTSAAGAFTRPQLTSV